MKRLIIITILLLSFSISKSQVVYTKSANKIMFHDMEDSKKLEIALIYDHSFEIERFSYYKKRKSFRKVTYFLSNEYITKIKINKQNKW